MNNDLIAVLLIVGLVVLVLFLYFKFFKIYKIKNIVFVDGALGTGKTFFCVSLAVRLYKKAVRVYKVKRFLLRALGVLSPKLLKKADSLEEPILYSNIRLRNVPFVKLTLDLVQRKNFRFAYKSILLIDEFSLMADQYLFKDRDVSERLSNFWKLWRHESRGGIAIVDSQSSSDLHYSIKYVLSDYLYIHHRTNLLFFSALKVQEMVYCADKDGQHVMNVRNEDIEETCKTILVFNKYFCMYDSYCYSIFTDDLPVWREVLLLGKDDSLKDPDLVTFKPYRFLTENMRRKDNE